MLESMFLLLTMYLFELGRNRNRYFYILSGTSLSLAILSKLTAVLFIPSMAIFILSQLYLKNLRLKDTKLIFYGFSIIIIPFLLLVVIPNYKDYLIMFEFMAPSGTFNIVSTIRNILFAPIHFTPFKYPSALFIFIALIFYFSIIISEYWKTSFREAINKLSMVEVYCISWIIGTTFSLCLNDQMGYDRRMIHLYFPVFTLASFYLLKSKTVYFPDIVKTNRTVRFILITTVGLFISTYIFGVYDVSTENSLPVMEFITNLNIYLIVGSSISIGLFLSYLFFKRNSKSLKVILVSGFILTNIALNSIWYGTASFTLRDESTRLGQFATKGIYLTGWSAYWLAINNEAAPLYYLRTYTEDKGINTWFRDYMQHEKFLLLSRVPKHGSASGTGYLDADLFNKDQLKLLTEIKLAPFPFTEEYRDNLKLYLVNGDKNIG